MCIRDSVKESLERRYGKYSVFDDNGNLKIYDCTIGDYYFKYADFGFQYGYNGAKFNSARFSHPFDVGQAKIAKTVRDNLFKTLRAKYEKEYIEEFVNEDGFKCYKFGLNPVEPDLVLGIISLYKGESKGGKVYLYLDLEYLPIHYYHKSSDF